MKACRVACFFFMMAEEIAVSSDGFIQKSFTSIFAELFSKTDSDWIYGIVKHNFK